MRLSARALGVSESLTLAANAKAERLAREGRRIDNLTAGQLPFPPPPEFADLLREEAGSPESHRYSPAAGFPELRGKLLDHAARVRGAPLREEGFGCVVTAGAKQAVFNALAALVDPGDEVLLLAPHWLSYPEMARLCGGVPRVAGPSAGGSWAPAPEAVGEAMTDRTRVLVVNSPNNPAGVHHGAGWMDGLARVLDGRPGVWIVSDEIYLHLSFAGPAPARFYQGRPGLLRRTVIVDGVSKCLGATGLRLGWALAPGALAEAMARIQGQTTSGPSSLVQRALMRLDLDESVPRYLGPVKERLRENAAALRGALEESGLGSLWYEPASAFYWLLDFDRTPRFGGLGGGADRSLAVADALLEECGAAVVPGAPFGAPGAVRISLVAGRDAFREACGRIAAFLAGRG